MSNIIFKTLILSLKVCAFTQNTDDACVNAQLQADVLNIRNKINAIVEQEYLDQENALQAHKKNLDAYIKSTAHTIFCDTQDLNELAHMVLALKSRVIENVEYLRNANDLQCVTKHLEDIEKALRAVLKYNIECEGKLKYYNSFKGKALFNAKRFGLALSMGTLTTGTLLALELAKFPETYVDIEPSPMKIAAAGALLSSLFFLPMTDDVADDFDFCAQREKQYLDTYFSGPNIAITNIIAELNAIINIIQQQLS